jgi:hypothetical protein
VNYHLWIGPLHVIAGRQRTHQRTGLIIQRYCFTAFLRGWYAGAAL